MNIVFDLDGTLICSKKRLHELFCDLVKNRKLSFSEYWNLKFSGNSNQAILKEKFGYSEVEITKFMTDWMSLIETDYYLEMDKLIDGMMEFLKRAKKKHTLYVCTARQSVQQVNKQLSSLAIDCYFTEVFVTEQKLTKIELLKENKIKFSKYDWMVGDTGHDIMAGKEIGIQTCAVLSGFMDEKSLVKYKPDLILNNATLLSV
jgi:phosphoglycolate phosphatase